jgi:hypothetical protein
MLTARAPTGIKATPTAKNMINNVLVTIQPPFKNLMQLTCKVQDYHIDKLLPLLPLLLDHAVSVTQGRQDRQGRPLLILILSLLLIELLHSVVILIVREVH